MPVGRATNDFNGMITLNDSGSFFWDCLTHETTIDEVVEKVISEYDIDTETAKRDIEKFIKMLEDNNLLEKQIKVIPVGLTLTRGCFFIRICR